MDNLTRLGSGGGGYGVDDRGSDGGWSKDNREAAKKKSSRKPGRSRKRERVSAAGPHFI